MTSGEAAADKIAQSRVLWERHLARGGAPDESLQADRDVPSAVGRKGGSVAVGGMVEIPLPDSAPLVAQERERLIVLPKQPAASHSTHTPVEAVQLSGATIGYHHSSAPGHGETIIATVARPLPQEGGTK